MPGSEILFSQMQIFVFLANEERKGQHSWDTALRLIVTLMILLWPLTWLTDIQGNVQTHTAKVVRAYRQCNLSAEFSAKMYFEPLLRISSAWAKSDPYIG